MECEPSQLQSTLFFPLMLMLIVVMIFGINAAEIWVRIAAGLGLIFAVPAAWLGIKMVFRKRPTLTINETGIEDKRLGVGHIPWSDISSVSVYEVRGKSLIELWLRDETAYVTRLPRWQQLVARITKPMGHSPFIISLTMLTPGFQPVYEYILRFVPAKDV